MQITQDDVDKFKANIQPDDHGCWIWIGGVDQKGYGVIRVGPERRHMKAHRFAYAVSRGVQIDRLIFSWKCATGKLCCNPDHLDYRKMRKPWPYGKDNGFYRHPETRAVGERHYNARLTDKQIDEIVFEAMKGTRTQKEVAEEYGIDPGYLSRLVRGLRRKDRS